MRRYVIGVDPGTPIGLALVSPAGNLKEAVSWDRVGLQLPRPGAGEDSSLMWANEPAVITNLLRSWINRYTTMPPFMVIEAANPRPGEGLVSACKYVGSVYMMRGIAAGLDLSYRVVAPSKWKRDLSLTGHGDGAKEASRARALSQWPAKAKLFNRKMDHNCAEAALLAYWGAKHEVFY